MRDGPVDVQRLRALLVTCSGDPQAGERAPLGTLPSIGVLQDDGAGRASRAWVPRSSTRFSDLVDDRGRSVCIQLGGVLLVDQSRREEGLYALASVSSPARRAEHGEANSVNDD